MPDQSQRNKRIAKNTIVLYIRMIFLMLINFYTSRLILSALGIEDYGIYNVVGGIVTMFSFLNSAMATGTQRYLTFELGKKNENQVNNVFVTSINIHFFIALIVILLAETVGLWFLNHKMVIPDNRMDAAMWVYQFSVISTAVMFVSVPYNALIIAHERMSVFAYISILEVVLKLLLVLFLFITHDDRLILYGLFILCVQIVIRVVYGIYCKIHFHEARYVPRFEKRLFREMLSFSGWNLWGSTATVAMTQGLNILLNLFFGPSVNAARGVAAQVQSAVTQFSSNFQTAMTPQIIKSYASGDRTYMHSLIFRSSRFSFCLLLCICMPVFMETDMLLGIWLKEVPEYSAMFLRLILCASIIQSVSRSLMTSAQATGKVRLYQSVVGGVMVMVLPVAYVLLKFGGSPASVFIAEIAVCAVAFVIRLLIIRPMIGLSLRKFFTNVIVRCFLVTVFASISPVVFNICVKDSLLSSISVCLVAAVSAAVCSFFIGMTRHERFVVVNVLKTKLSRKHMI